MGRIKILMLAAIVSLAGCFGPPRDLVPGEPDGGGGGSASVLIDIGNIAIVVGAIALILVLPVWKIFGKKEASLAAAIGVSALVGGIIYVELGPYARLVLLGAIGLCVVALIALLWKNRIKVVDWLEDTLGLEVSRINDPKPNA